MGIVNGINIVNNLLAGTLSGAQLQTALAVGANAASWVQVVAMRRQIQVLCNTPAAVAAVTASATACAAITANDVAFRQWLLYGTSFNWRSFSNRSALLASAPAMAEVMQSGAAVALLLASAANINAVIATPTALSALVGSSVAMNAVVASSAALALLAASSVGMAAVAASSTAKMSIFGSDLALDALASSAVALAALRSAAGYALVNVANSVAGPIAIPSVVAGGSYILVGVSNTSSVSQQMVSLTTRRIGSGRPIVAGPNILGSTATAATLCTPLVAPFTFQPTVGGGGTWYFGMLRCDV